MMIRSIKKKINEKGICKGVIYYPARLISKINLRLVGGFSAKYGTLQKDCIVFKNRTMQDMTDNARAFFEYLIENERYKNYKIIWMVSDKKKFRGYRYKNVKFVTAESENGWTSPLAYYYGAVAGHFLYTNNTAYLNLYHCEGQVTVNLWHGCGYKDVVKEGRDLPTAKSMMHFDHALVPGPVFVQTKSDYWNCEQTKIQALGYPRYDWMLHPSLDKKTILRRLFDRKEQKTVIWMPTFRQSELIQSAEGQIQMPFWLPGLKNEAELQQLDAYLKKKDILLIIKRHPVQSGWQMKDQRFSNICDVTQEDLEREQIQLYELISICDGLLSDYSSVAVDYMLLDRPLGYILTDLEQYAKTRGFVFEDPLEYMPGEQIYDLQGIERFIEQIFLGSDPFQARRRKLLPLMHTMPVKENYCAQLAQFLKL